MSKEPYKRDYILQKKPVILKSPLIVATPQYYMWLSFDITSSQIF